MSHFKRLWHKLNIGRVYYIDPGGNDENSGLSANDPWRTVAKVNSFSFEPGDTIKFKSGEIWEDEQLVPPTSGVQGREITFTTYGDDGNAIIDNGETNDNAFYSNHQSYLVLDSLDMYGGVLSTVWLNSDHVTLQHCQIQGNGSSHANGINLTTGADYVTIDDCHIFEHLCIDSGGAGIFALGVNSLAVLNSSVENNGQDIQDNGIHVSSCNGVLIQGNTCDTNTGSGIRIYDGTTNAIVAKNVLFANQNHGITVVFLDSDNGTVVHSNLCYHNGNGSIFLATTAPDIKCYFNTCVNSQYDNGLHVGAAGCDVRNNIVYQIVGGSSSNRPYRFQEDDVIGEWDYNLAYNGYASDNYRVAVRTSPETGYTWAEWQAHANTPDVHGVNGLPVFSAPGSGNYHLQVTSAARGAGIAIEGYETDMDGVARLDPPSMGCYEYVGVS